MLVLVRYGELALKSKPVRRRFEKKLIENIKIQLRNFEFALGRDIGRILVDLKNGKFKELKGLEILRKIPGIVSISPCLKTNLELENLFQKCSEILKNKQVETFGLRVSRVGTHNFTSQEIAIKLGELIRENFNLEVDLTDPDLWIFIEIRNKNSYIYSEKIMGVGGLPIGVEGNVLSFLENEFDFYASFLIMRRGCRIFPITFKETTERQLEFLELLKQFDPNIKFLKTERKNLKNLAEFFNCKAIVSGLTIENLDQIKNFEKYEIPFLFPNCALSKERVLKKFEELKSNK